MTSDLLEDYEMTSAVGNMVDNTLALSRILMAGILDQHPRLKLRCPHLGGTLPYIIGRLDHQTRVLERGPKYLTRAPSEYLKQVWLDIVSPLPTVTRHVLVEATSSGMPAIRSDLWAVGLMPGTASHLAFPANNATPVQPANIDGDHVVANNVIADFGHGDSWWLWTEGFALPRQPVSAGT